ncbi:serine hydrolase domain-containing protein [Streptomyces roseifaciens]
MGAAHLVVALLVQDGVLDLDREVAAYWPEFAAEGKGRLTLRELLAHRSGVVGVDGGFTTEELADDRLMAARLAAQRPFWEPGTAYGYHAFVIGALTGEVVRRVTGRSIQEIYEERIRAPYGLDFHLGLPEALEARCAGVLPLLPSPEKAERLAAGALDPDLVTGNEDVFGLGFEELSGRCPFLGPDAFGHSGAAGSLGFADPDSGVAYAYTRRRFAFPSGFGAGIENHRLAEAVVRAAAARQPGRHPAASAPASAPPSPPPPAGAAPAPAPPPVTGGRRRSGDRPSAGGR